MSPKTKVAVVLSPLARAKKFAVDAPYALTILFIVLTFVIAITAITVMGHEPGNDISKTAWFWWGATAVAAIFTALSAWQANIVEKVVDKIDK